MLQERCLWLLADFHCIYWFGVVITETFYLSYSARVIVGPYFVSINQ